MNVLYKTQLPKNVQRGFTLVELLVVIAIIGVLVAMLLPAVQAAREAARRMQCSNHLHQIGIGIHNYHNAFRSLPTNFTGAKKNGSSCGSGFYSWLAQLLPMVEQGPLYESIDFSVSMSEHCNYPFSSSYTNFKIPLNHKNAVAARTLVPTYLCPSDPNGVVQINDDEQTAPGSYVGNVGWPQRSFWEGGTPIDKQNGVIGIANDASTNTWQAKSIKLRDLTDGTSHTAAVSERMIGQLFTVAGFFGSTYVPDTVPESMQSFCGGSTSARSLPRWVTYCGSVSHGDPSYAKKRGHSWISGWTFSDNTYMHLMPIGSRNCHIYGGEEIGNNIVTPSSYHIGGLHSLMADGSVGFRSQSIDQELWWSMGSGNDAQVVQAE